MTVNLIDRAVLAWNPEQGLKRLRARRQAEILANYDATSTRSRTSSLRRSATDADAAASQRLVLAQVARDLVRNTPFAARAQAVIASNVVGAGIIPKVAARSKAAQADFRAILTRHLESTDIDALGRQNLFGLQKIIVNTVVDAGECLVRVRTRLPTDGLALPFQLEVLEPDYLDASRDGEVTGGYVRDGIQYDQLDRRTGYWLFLQHPGSNDRALRLTTESRFVPAGQIMHIFRQDRPGQRRGVSWFAPIALMVRDLHDFHEAQLVRQKLAACFAAFITRAEDDALPVPGAEPSDVEEVESITPGAVEYLRPGESVSFAAPPGVQGFDEFSRAMLRGIASGMNITYEALTGDYSQVNFTSGRMGRQEMRQAVEAWQWLMMIPQFLEPLARVCIREYRLIRMAPNLDVSLNWVPPSPIIVDPAREYSAIAAKIAAGLSSVQSEVRALGYDPEAILAEQVDDKKAMDEAGLNWTSMPGAKAQPKT